MVLILSKNFVQLRVHVKKIAFLAGHSAKALTPDPLPVSRTIAILCKFFFIFDIYIIYVFLKPANSYTENGIKQIRKCPLEKFMCSGNWKTGQDTF